VGKKLEIWQLIWPPVAAGAPFHGTNGTMVNPALLANLCQISELATA